MCFVPFMVYFWQPANTKHVRRDAGVQRVREAKRLRPLRITNVFKTIHGNTFNTYMWKRFHMYWMNILLYPTCGRHRSILSRYVWWKVLTKMTLEQICMYKTLLRSNQDQMAKSHELKSTIHINSAIKVSLNLWIVSSYFLGQLVI